MRGWSKRPDATRIAWGMVGWLAWRRFRSARGEMIVRGMVGVFTVMLLLGASALAPSSLNVAEREANAYPMWVPDESQDRGIRYDVRRGFTWRSATSMFSGWPGWGSTGPPAMGESRCPGRARCWSRRRRLLCWGSRRSSPSAIRGRSSAGSRSSSCGPRSLMIWVGVAESELPPDSLWLAEEWGHDDLRSSVPDVIQVGYVVVIIGFVDPLLALSSIVASLGFRRREACVGTDVGGALAEGHRAVRGDRGSLILMTAATVGGVALFWAVVPPLAPTYRLAAGCGRATSPCMCGTIVLCVLALVLSATLTWVRLSRVRDRAATPATCRRLLPARVAHARRSGDPACPVPRRPGADQYRKLPASRASMPLGMLGLVWGLPGIVRAASGVISHVGVAGTWAGRVVEKEAAAVSRTSMGIVMLLVAAGVMLVFFPLMSATNAVAQKAMSGLIGPDTLVGSGEDTKAHRGAWASIRPAAGRPSLSDGINQVGNTARC